MGRSVPRGGKESDGVLTPLLIPPPGGRGRGIDVYFSPRGGCEAAVVEQVAAANHSIDVQAYSFTNTAIATALGEAHERGVKARVVRDHQTNVTGKYGGATYLANHGVEPWTDAEHPISHNEVVVIDGQTVIAGSFNFTRQAEQGNAENLLVIRDKPKIAEAYGQHFEHPLAHARRNEG